MIITPLYAGLLGLWYLVLSAQVIRGRRAGGHSLGDGGDTAMQRVIRGHGNFAEYVPFILLLIALLEMRQIPTWQLHGLGLALLIGRVLHGYALSFTQQFVFGRFFGTVLTLSSLGIAAVLCVQIAFTRL
jgi:hypothetical protein